MTTTGAGNLGDGLEMAPTPPCIRSAEYVPLPPRGATRREDAMRDMLDGARDLPRGAWLWTFGSARLRRAAAGWTFARGQGVASNGHLLLTPDGRLGGPGWPPRDLVVHADRIDTLLLGCLSRNVASVRVLVRERPDRSWHTVAVEQVQAGVCARMGTTPYP